MLVKLTLCARYVLFSIGNLTPLFAAAFPKCWGKKSSKNPKIICDANWIAAVNYLEVIGIIVGQILVGFIGDWYVFCKVKVALGAP